MTSKLLLGGLLLGGCLLTSGCGAPAKADLWLGGQVPKTGTPAYEYRILDHWDNLDDTVERGYAGKSIWEWTSPEIPVGRIRRYGELNRAIGINGAVLDNVNANPKILDTEHIERVAKIAAILREYGIRTYLAINFATPKTLGGLPTADPLNPDVIKWWNDKVAQIYKIIPDFGGFLVKAGSEGQSGPQDYGRTHADGANMLADALAPHNGIVMWRAFVYAPSSPDRAMQAYDEFTPLDGKFRDNVVIQIKNGPVDFQPREPFSPLFGAMPKSSMAPEFQITQEYLGQSKNLVFTAPVWEECLKADTYRDGPGSTVAKTTTSGKIKLIAGVANTGQDDNWCGSVFAQANWYAFGRQAWDPSLTSAQIAEEWLRLSFKKPWYMSEKRFTSKFIEPVKEMMVSSRETCVDYMMPLGLHHIFSSNEHYGPEPWYAPRFLRTDWTPPYYHKADTLGIGFDRTRKGTGAVNQYNEPLASLYNGSNCPESLLLWFHHVPWTYRMSSGRTLWDELCLHYDKGLKTVRGYRALWAKMRPYVDKKRYEDMAHTLEVQEHDAAWWRDACVQYFGTFSRMPVPSDVEAPATPLDSLKKTNLPAPRGPRPAGPGANAAGHGAAGASAGHGAGHDAAQMQPAQ